MTKKPLVIVTWDDADSSSVAVITDENIDDVHKPSVIKTVGWLLREDERGVSLCNEFYEEAGKERFRGHTIIPRPLVHSVVPVIKPRKRRERKRAKSGSSESVSEGNVPAVDGSDRQEGC
jgi:hypothetical protein